MGKLIEVGDQFIDKAIVAKLLSIDGLLHPTLLATISPDYALFEPVDPLSLVWVKPETRSYFEGLFRRCEKLVVSLSGIPASGKDTIRAWVERNNPGLVAKMITATTREPRPGEIHGKDYYFFSETDFLALLDSDNLIEHSIQPTGHYGMPVASITEAFGQARIAISQMEMSGWPKLKSKVSEMFSTNPPPVLSLFVLPQMSFRSYTELWLPQFRSKIQKEKTLRAAWELSVAAGRVDAFIINPISEDEKPGEAAAKAVANLLASFLI